MKKILFVMYHLDVGGVPSSLKSLCDNLKNKYKISIFVLSGDNSGNIDFKDYLLPISPSVDAYYCNHLYAKNKTLYKWVIKLIKRVSYLLKINFGGFLARRACHKIERTYNFDLIVAYQEGPPTIFCKYFSNSNKVAWIHCDYSQAFPSGDQEQLYSKYKRIINVSKYCMNQFLNIYPSLKDTTRYIYNFFDKDRILRLSSFPIENPLFKTDKFCIVSIGRVVPLKRYSSIPSIANSLRSKGLDFRWYILGSSTDLSEQNKLQEEIAKNNVQEYVIWCGGQTNPYNYLSKADLLVSLSTTEACPMIFNEARVLNVPIISNSFGSSFEFIEDGVDGVIVPFEKMVHSISEIMTNAEKYQHIKNNAGRSYIDNDGIRKQIISMFEEVTN